MLIRYGIWRRVSSGKRHHYQHESHVVAINTFNWEDKQAHSRLRNRIMNKHPGWCLSGYCVETPLGNQDLTLE